MRLSPDNRSIPSFPAFGPEAEQLSYREPAQTAVAASRERVCNAVNQLPLDNL